MVAYQWGWNYRLPGQDGILGKTSVNLINDNNPYGLDLNDPNSKVAKLSHDKRAYSLLGELKKIWFDRIHSDSIVLKYSVL